LLALTVFAVLIAGGYFMYKRSQAPAAPPIADLSDDTIKREWRKLGFFCELDEQKKVWTLTGSRAGLLYFPDLLLGYVIDPTKAENGEHAHYGPYGSLQVMTWTDPGFSAHAIRGSLTDLARLADIIGAKLASAQPGEPIRIREEYAPDSPFSLLLDVRVDGFDPASADGERLGAVTTTNAPAAPKA
jgi:hypothetical protein